MGKKLRVLVCGTTFGQLYIEAIQRLQEDFRLAGILAEGSPRSKACALKNKVPLYRSVEELPGDLDAACVVIRSGVLGGVGTELAERLLARGLHVLQEHPVHYRDLEGCLRLARENRVCYQIGNLYAHLPEVKKFAACAGYLNKAGRLVYANAAFASQVSYPAMQILQEALPSIREWKLAGCMDCGAFQVMTGTFGKVPVALEIHNEVNPRDPNNHMHMMHEVELVYEGGRLVLGNTFGPLVWHPKMHADLEYASRGEVQGEFPDYMNEAAGTILGSFRETDFKSILTSVWPQAIARDLLSLKESIEGGRGYARKVQQELLCAKQWMEITRDLGYPRIINAGTHEPLSGARLRQVALEAEAVLSKQRGGSCHEKA